MRRVQLASPPPSAWLPLQVLLHASIHRFPPSSHYWEKKRGEKRNLFIRNRRELRTEAQIEVKKAKRKKR